MPVPQQCIFSGPAGAPLSGSSLYCQATVCAAQLRVFSKSACLPVNFAEARSVVVTQPNNKLSRVLKALLKEVPAHMNAINNASLAASMAMSDTTAALVGQAAADVAREKLQQRLQLIQSLQVRCCT